MAGPCADWPIDPACNYGIPDNPASRSAVQAFAVKVASEWLWLLTAGIYGTCPRKIRPCGRRCVGFDYYPSQLVDGTWVNITCTCDSSPCGCCYVCEIELDGPVDSVTEIKIGGVVVNSSTYRIDDGFKLVRVGNNPCWPSCQNLSAADTETNTFSVTYQQGLAVPTMGKRALGALAAEIVKSCAGSACRLPAGVQSITRQGISMEMIDVDLLKSRLTGIPEVDSWVNLVNPQGQLEPSTVWSPDLQPVLRTQTWP